MQFQGHSVTNFSTKWKPVCNFLCVNNSNFPPILHHFRDMWIIDPISAVNRKSLFLMHLFGVNLTKLSYGVRVCEVYFNILNRLGTNHQCDRQTDRRQTSWVIAKAPLHYIARFTVLHGKKSCWKHKNSSLHYKDGKNQTQLTALSTRRCHQTFLQLQCQLTEQLLLHSRLPCT